MRSFSLISLFVFVSCATLSYLGLHEHTLYKKDKDKRSKVMSDIMYELDLDFSRTSSNTYSGKVNISFKLSENKDHLRLDFYNGEIEKILINDKVQSSFSYNKYFINLDKKYLRTGSNFVEIEFKQTFSNKGEGIKRFVDPVDNQEYIYTDFEPYNANHFFPCFDQPDLKAQYKMSLLAPANWKAITSVLPNKTKNTENLKHWSFPWSQTFSTYIFHLSLGPFHEWKSRYKNIPMKLYARKSLALFVDADSWFQTTKKGMRYFERYFDYAFPFTKYDQIIVPDFAWGGMENVGAVTYSERFIFRTQPVKSQLERRANVILHELAHMWFGNLVTMEWWNGLWLNESFATFMAYKAMETLPEFKTAWESFYNRTKGWAYWSDQLDTTHPIEVPVKDTKSAFANFDGITYGKGASVLKQLEFFIGKKEFQKGIQNYFKKHEYGNTNLRDFMMALESSSNTNLNKWEKEWLLKSGLNSIEVDSYCKDGRLTDLKVFQKVVSGDNSLREHRTNIGLFKTTEEGIELIKKMSVKYQSRITNVKIKKRVDCPDFIFPNLEDYDYVKSILNHKSLSFAYENISKINDDLLRAMVWDSLWNMVIDRQWPLNKMALMLLREAPQEKNNKIRDRILRNLASVSFYYASGTKKQWILWRNELERVAKETAYKADLKTDDKRIWVQAFINNTWSSEGIEFLLEKLKDSKILGLEWDFDLRWMAIQRLSRLGVEGVHDLIAKALTEDNSSLSQNNALAAKVLFPSLENKLNYYSKLLTDESLSFPKQSIIMKNLFPYEQAGFKKNVIVNWPQIIERVSPGKDDHFMGNFARYMHPFLCDKDNYNENSKKIKASFPIIVDKNLSIQLQEYERCYKIIEKMN